MQEKIEYNNIPVMIGWLCPKCEHILSPYVESCPYCEVAHKESSAEEYLKEEFNIEATCNTCKYRDIGTVTGTSCLPKYKCMFHDRFVTLSQEACNQYEPLTVTSSASINFKPYGKDPEEIKADDMLSVFKQFGAPKDKEKLNENLEY